MHLLFLWCRRNCLVVLMILLSWPRLCQAASNVVYSTGFEQSEGYNMGFTLAGQQGWVATRDDATDVSAANGNQMGFIGYFPPQPGSETFASVWRPINLTSIPSNAVVRFSVDMTIIDSTDLEFDEFRWSAYNASSNRLFSLVFDNNSFSIYYILSDGRSFDVHTTGFRDGVSYKLMISMDFPHNRWNASFGGIDLQINNSITASGSPLTFGDMDAVWFYNDPSAPGDNYMLFDNYKVTLESTNPPSLQIFRPANNAFVVRLFGENGQKYVLDRSATLLPSNWSALTQTNTLTSGYFDTTNALPSGVGRGFYRGRLVP